MPDSPTPQHKSDFVCDCEEWMRSACKNEAFYKESHDRRYCILHWREGDKRAEFRIALKRKLDKRDFDSRGVWFPEELRLRELVFDGAVDFNHATFTQDVDFNGSVFNAAANFFSASFKGRADFSSATFGGSAYFESASFGGIALFISVAFNGKSDFNSAAFLGLADFTYSQFKANGFLGATFGAVADFRFATFDQVADFSASAFKQHAYFSSASFKARADFNTRFTRVADFNSAIFSDQVRFSGVETGSVVTKGFSLELQFIRIEKPQLLSFHTLTLRPHWFVNVDSRKFEFTNVHWDFHGLSRRGEGRLKDSFLSQSLLALACRNLAVNAEENHRYEEASRFRYIAMDIRRRAEPRGFALWRLSWWYWFASGYGERALRALLVLLGIWLVAGMLYTRLGFTRWEPRIASEADAAVAKRDEAGAPLKFSRALSYSAGVMTLQKPEPKPATTAAQTIVLFETIFGPVQAALLALAIRRKFMR